jgi:L-alanine-DL-glutamate epimerase-like enolase superfamily enzyme
MPKILKLSTAVVQANFNWHYVRVYSDASGGLYGTGECFFAPGLPRIIEEFSDMLAGEESNNIERLVERMRWAAAGAGSMGGIVWNAITGIEAALWDLKGKYFGLPVWQLLGGKFRDDVRIYADCHAAEALECVSNLHLPTRPAWVEQQEGPELSPDEVIAGSVERAKMMAGKGYTALKFDLDLPGSVFDSATGYPLRVKDIDWMIRLTHALRDAIGPDVDLAVDAHWRYRANDILQVMKEVEDCHLMWFEDPVPPNDEKSLAYLRGHTAPGLLEHDRQRPLRRGYARHSEGRRAGRGAQDRRYVRGGQQSLRAAYDRQPAGTDGDGAPCRYHPELPGLRVPCPRRTFLLRDGTGRHRRVVPSRLGNAHEPPRLRCRAERRGWQALPLPWLALVR